MCLSEESRYSVRVVCPLCGGNVAHVNGTGHREGLLSIAIAKCVDCRREVEVCCRLRVLPRDQHQRRSEVPA